MQHYIDLQIDSSHCIPEGENLYNDYSIHNSKPLDIILAWEMIIIYSI